MVGIGAIMPTKQGDNMSIRIRSKKDGYRRAGVAHPAEWVVEQVPEDLGKTSKDKRK